MREEQVQRFDRGEITSVEITPQGFLKVPGFATRTGVFTYRDSSGKVRRELRHPDDVFDPESLATLKNVPVTLQHPPKMLTPENVSQYIKGYSTERLEVNRDLVETDLIITHQEAISAVQDLKMRELSSGYVSDVIPEQGVYNGAEYDHRQINIKYNHIAIVDRGRAGPEVRLRMDSADAVMEAQEKDDSMIVGLSHVAPVVQTQPISEETRTVVISGRKVELPVQVAGVVADMLDRYDQMRGELMKLTEETMKKDAEEKKDMDVSPKSVSPQVPVEQKAPDGRSSSGKAGAGDSSGAAKAKGDADLDMKKDAEGEKKEDAEGSPVENLKKELKETKDALESAHAKLDSMKDKMDAMANESMGKGEKKMDGFSRAEMRERIKLERKAERLVTKEVAEKFDSMSDDEIRTAAIRAKAPKADLTGKGSVYLQVRFDSLTEEVEASETVRREMGSRLLQKDHADSEPSDPTARRRAMIESSRSAWQQPLSAAKK